MILGALFGLLGAVAIGVSDLFGRRIIAASSALTAAASMQFIALLTTVGATRVQAGEPLTTDVVLGAASGVGLGIGLSCYYGGLSRSSATVVAPIVATLSAVIPFVYTVIIGDPPTVIGWAGAALAFAGLALTSIGGGRVSNVRAGVTWGLVSGLGYGFGVAVLADVTEAAGQWPSVSQRAAAFVMLSAVALALRTPVAPPRSAMWSLLAAGGLTGIVTVLIILGVAEDARATVVLVSTFPAFSVAIGWLYFRDAVSRTQLVGLAAVLIGVAGVVGG
ncbi:MAG: DMT family transporter [Actinomycetota bacterium]